MTTSTIAAMDSPTGGRAETQASVVSIYEHSVPPFAEAELVSLYAHIFSSPAQFRVYGGLDSGTHTYVVRTNGRVTAVLLFRIDRRTARVLNEQIALDAEEVTRFVRRIFATYGAVDVVAFPAVRAGIGGVPFPHQHFYRTEDIVVRLPATPDDYMAALGKATRKNIKKHANRLSRDYPSLRYDVYLDEQIGEQHVRDVFALNHARMSHKNKVSELDDDEARRLARLVQQGGMACMMTIDGRVAAGAICSRVGSHIFMHVGSHHPDFDSARLGTICFIRTICESITRGATDFHFMWGRFDYKYALLGVKTDYDELLVYRSPSRLVRHAGLAFGTALNGYRRELKFRLLDIANRENGGGLGYRALNWLRDMKQGRFGLRA